MSGKFKWGIVFARLFVIATSFFWNWRHETDSHIALARVAAISHFEMDPIYRDLGNLQDSVSVSPSQPPPTDYDLKDVRSRDVTFPSRANPAYMTRYVHKLDSKKTGFRGHLTSLTRLHPENRADDWETKALHSFESGAKECSSIETMDGSLFFRFMRPLLFESKCLSCHASQGYKAGDNCAGMSVSISYAPYLEATRHQFWLLLMVHGLMGSPGLLGLCFFLCKIN